MASLAERNWTWLWPWLERICRLWLFQRLCIFLRLWLRPWRRPVPILLRFKEPFPFNLQAKQPSLLITESSCSSPSSKYSYSWSSCPRKLSGSLIAKQWEFPTPWYPLGHPQLNPLLPTGSHPKEQAAWEHPREACTQINSCWLYW